MDATAAQYPLTIDPWVQVAKLTASDAANNDYLGISVSVSSDGSTIVAGAAGKNTNQGAAYVYVKSGSWVTATQTAKLTASDAANDDNLGNSVSASSDGSMIVAGAYGKNTNQGAAYVFLRRYILNLPLILK